MNRILSSLGCFGLILLAIMYALGVTEAINFFLLTRHSQLSTPVLPIIVL